MWKSCPASGKRAPELACGALPQELKRIWQIKQLKVFDLCTGLQKSDHDSVVDDFEKARSVMETILIAKTSFWQVIPWKLCGLCHYDRQLAQECARLCIGTYDARPNPQEHHRLSH